MIRSSVITYSSIDAYVPIQMVRIALQGPRGPTIPVTVDNPKGTITPFVPINCAVRPDGIYLIAPSSWYTINISPSFLGSAYQPNTTDPLNEPGTWKIESIFAAIPSSTGPTGIFDMSQQPVTFFIQNVSGVPIKVVFNSNDASNAIVYFSFGASPNKTPSSYLLQPLSILIFQTVFTSNNAIRFYNSFLDALKFDQLYRIADRADQAGYYVTETSSVYDPAINVGTISVSTTLPLASMVTNLAQNNYIVEADIVLDGTGLPADAVALLILYLNRNVTLTLKELVGINNYHNHPVPTQLLKGRTYFIVVRSRRVTCYDPLTHIKYTNGTLVLGEDLQQMYQLLNARKGS